MRPSGLQAKQDLSKSITRPDEDVVIILMEILDVGAPCIFFVSEGPLSCCRTEHLSVDQRFDEVGNKSSVMLFHYLDKV